MLEDVRGFPYSGSISVFSQDWVIAKTTTERYRQHHARRFLGPPY